MTAGTGTVIGFTTGEEPFLKIRRDTRRGFIGLNEIRRKPQSVSRLPAQQ